MATAPRCSLFWARSSAVKLEDGAGFHAMIMDMHASANPGVIAAAILAAMTAACGSGTPASPSTGGPLHTIIATVMLESTGPTPREVTIGVGEFVSFMNHERVSYTVASGSAPLQGATCTEIDAVGLLRSDEIRQTAPFSAAKTCDFHVRSGQTVLYGGRIVVR
jgi:hypothetical protein